MVLVDIVNGPNINIVERRGSLYHGTSLKEIEARSSTVATDLGLHVQFFQSNNEGDLVTYIQDSNADAMIINPAGYTHTSIVILDALLSFKGPVIEVHISNIMARDITRRTSITAAATIGTISGFGVHSYTSALYLIKSLQSSGPQTPLKLRVI